jgi:spermidine/putrescine transport system substrate-binding protein
MPLMPATGRAQVTKLTNEQRAALATLKAARALSRRAWLKGAAAGVVAATGPWIVRDAFSSSGELNLLNWSDELPDPVIPDFTAKTGVKVNTTPFSQNEEQVNKLQSTKGQGFDLCQPTRDRAPQFKDLGLLQPFDLDKMPNSKNIIPSMIEASTSVWTWDGKLYHLPHCWGTEAVAWRADEWKGDANNLSFGDLWADDVKGKIIGRPHSLITGIGLWMDGTGQLPSNRMLDSFKDEDTMRKIWTQLTQFAVDHKPWVKQFWSSADDTKSGLMQNGCVLGQTWDGPVLSLKKEGKPVSYQAPKEGAIAWLDGWAMPSAAQNVDQAYAWLDYLQTPETSAKIAEGSGYNPIVTGADALLSAAAKKLFQEAYPGDAVARLWWRPPEPSWYGAARNEFAQKFLSA